MRPSPLASPAPGRWLAAALAIRIAPVAACGDDAAQPTVDAASTDAPTDAATDAPVDAPIDAAIDAIPPPSGPVTVHGVLRQRTPHGAPSREPG